MKAKWEYVIKVLVITGQYNCHILHIIVVSIKIRLLVSVSGWMITQCKQHKQII